MVSLLPKEEVDGTRDFLQNNKDICIGEDTYVLLLLLQIPIGEIFLGVFNHFVEKLLSVVNSAGNQGIYGLKTVERWSKAVTRFYFANFLNPPTASGPPSFTQGGLP